MAVRVIMTGMAIIVVTIARMTAVGHRAVGMAHGSVGQMGVIVIVFIDRKCGINPVAKHAAVLFA